MRLRLDRGRQRARRRGAVGEAEDDRRPVEGRVGVATPSAVITLRKCRRVGKGCARRLARSAGESPAQVRHSESPGSECCVTGGNDGHEAYTATAWGV